MSDKTYHSGLALLTILWVVIRLGAAAVAQPLGATADRPAPFADPAALDPKIPSPETVTGRAIGDGAIRYDAMVRYLTALDEASPLVTLTPYGQTHEGRALYYLTVTSQAHHGRLADIQKNNAKLADPRGLTENDAAKILDSLPGVAWLAYSIHGDELSSTDAAVQVAYQLAAGTDEATRKLRDELVIHIDPLMNPDGRERYLSQLQHLVGKVPNPDYQSMQHSGLWSAGRGNHYLFDLNRDWLMQVHPETRTRAALILAWHPHLLVDSHEMGALDTYLFDPPREPYNLELGPQNLAWRRRFAADQGRAFDRHGWSYYTGEWYEEWYPGYTNAWANLLGAVGLLYEQAGVDGAMVRQPSGGTLTYREAVHHQLVSSLANLETLRSNRRDILRDYLAERRGAVAGNGEAAAPGQRRYFVLARPADRSRFSLFLDLLLRHGIETTQSSASFDARDVVDIWGKRSDTKSFPSGTLIIDSAQPNRRLIRAILDLDPHMSDMFLNEERKDLENHRGTRVYDVTAWNPSMAYGLEGHWAADIGNVAREPATPPPPPTRIDPASRPAFGYLIDGADSDIYTAIVRLLDRGCKIRVANKPFKTAAREYRPGGLLLRRNENPADLSRLIAELTNDLMVDVTAVETALSKEGPDLGGRRYELLEQPRVAIATQWPISTTGFGHLWHLLDFRLGMRVSPFNIQSIGRLDMRNYNVLILPHSFGGSSLEAVLGKPALDRLKSWVEAGGTLIACGESAAFLAGKDRGFSGVRLRGDVLDQLAAYEEAVKRERASRHPQVQPASVWETLAPSGPPAATPPPATPPGPTPPGAPATGTTPPAPKPDGKPDAETLKREDEWQRLFSPSGVIVAAQLDPEHWLTFGLTDNALDGIARLPVLLSGSNAFMSQYPVATPVRLMEDAPPDAEKAPAPTASETTPSASPGGRLRLSGLFWPEGRRRFSSTAYATVERVGNGQVILFAGDPIFRGYFEGTGRLLLNAVILGPGMGASAPVPW